MRAPQPILESSAPRVSTATQVVVLGMHRSGTSVLTGLLRLLGLWAGGEDDFNPADAHNQAGYWEHRDVWAVDEAILHALGTSWCEVTDLDLSRLGGRQRARIREVVQDLDRHGAWVIKDPRLCLLFPLWREILDQPFCILVHREPLAVARSLAARDGLPILYGIALWERYTLAALASSRSLPRLLVSHREMMADPMSTLRRLHRFLPQLARFPLPAEEEVRAFLDPALVHHPHEPEIERSYLTPPQQDLADALAAGTALDLDPIPPLSPGARELLAARPSLLPPEHALVSRAADLHRAISWVEELDAIISAILASRSWKTGSTLATAARRLLGRRAKKNAAERRARLMAEVRLWQHGDGDHRS